MRGSTRIVLSVVVFGEASLAILPPGVFKTLPPQELNKNQTLPEDFTYWQNVLELQTPTTEFPTKLYSSYSGYNGYPFNNITDQIDGENTTNVFHSTLLEGSSEPCLEYADRSLVRSLGDLVESLENVLEETLDSFLGDLEDSLDFLELPQLVETTISQTAITEVPMIATETTHIDSAGYGHQTNYYFDNDGHFAIGRELEVSASKETTSRLEPEETCVISASFLTLTLTSVNISVSTELLSLSSHSYINRSQVLYPLASLNLTMEFPHSYMTSQLSFLTSPTSSLALLKHAPKSPLTLELLELTPCTSSKYAMSTRRTIIYSSSSHRSFSFLRMFFVFLVHI